MLLASGDLEPVSQVPCSPSPRHPSAAVSYPLERTVRNHGSSQHLGHKLSGRRFRFQCESLANMHAWQNKSAKEPSLLTLLRKLFFVAAVPNFTATLLHLTALLPFPQADAEPTRAPPELFGL